MFKSFYELHERCAVCDTRYETAPGAWLGGLAIGYGIGAMVALALALIEMAWASVRALGIDPMWTIAAVSLAAKALWFALLYKGGSRLSATCHPGRRAHRPCPRPRPRTSDAHHEARASRRAATSRSLTRRHAVREAAAGRRYTPRACEG